MNRGLRRALSKKPRRIDRTRYHPKGGHVVPPKGSKLKFTTWDKVYKIDKKTGKIVRR